MFLEKNPAACGDVVPKPNSRRRSSAQLKTPRPKVERISNKSIALRLFG